MVKDELTVVEKGAFDAYDLSDILDNAPTTIYGDAPMVYVRLGDKTELLKRVELVRNSDGGVAHVLFTGAVPLKEIKV